MTRPTTLFLCVAVIVFRNISFAQDDLTKAEQEGSKRDTKIYNIRALDGPYQKVQIKPDYEKKILRITGLKDTINIYDYWGVPPDVTILNKDFLEINYEVRGGSNLGLGNIMIVCLNGNKLYEAIHVLRYIKSEASFVIDSEKFNYRSNYNIKITLIGDNKKSYRLKVAVHDAVWSQHDPETNYNYNDQTILNFDERRNVFFNIKESIYDRFSVFDPKTGKRHQQKIRGNFPVVIFGKETYYYLNDGWYSLGSNNHLDKYTSRSGK